MAQNMGLIKRGFHEVPHLMVGGIVFSIGVVWAVINTRRLWKYEKNQRQWKRRYTVVREEDFDPKKQVHPIDKQYPWF